MELYNCHEMTKQEYISHGFGLGLNVVIVLYFIAYMLGWCRDPLHEGLRSQITQLENTNDSLLGQIDDLQEENAFLSHRVNEYDEFVPGAKHVFELRKKMNLEDTQG